MWSCGCCNRNLKTPTKRRFSCGTISMYSWHRSTNWWSWNWTLPSPSGIWLHSPVRIRTTWSSSCRRFVRKWSWKVWMWCIWNRPINLCIDRKFRFKTWSEYTLHIHFILPNAATHAQTWLSTWFIDWLWYLLQPFRQPRRNFASASHTIHSALRFSIHTATKLADLGSTLQN